MIKINSLILILLLLFLIFNSNKKEKYENTKKEKILKNEDKKISHKIVSNENFSEFNKIDKLDKSANKFNLENKITLKNHKAKKIDFKYDELEDISNTNIKNFKYDTEKKLKEDFIYDVNENSLIEDIDHIKEKSNELVEKSTKFYDIDDKNELILEKMMNKEDVKIEFDPFGKNILDRSKTSKPYKAPFNSSQLENYKGKTIKEIYNIITKNNFDVNKNTNIFGFKN